MGATGNPKSMFTRCRALRIILPPSHHDTAPERMTAIRINGVTVVCGGVMRGGSGDDDTTIRDGHMIIL